MVEFHLGLSVRENKHTERVIVTLISCFSSIKGFIIMTDINDLETALTEEFEMFSITISRSDVMEKRKIHSRYVSYCRGRCYSQASSERDRPLCR